MIWLNHYNIMKGDNDEIEESVAWCVGDFDDVLHDMRGIGAASV